MLITLLPVLLQGKSVHCGFDPAVDPPEKHDVPLPDPDMPVRFKPAVPSTPGPGAKLKTAESFAHPVAKKKPDKPSQVIQPSDLLVSIFSATERMSTRCMISRAVRFIIAFAVSSGTPGAKWLSGRCQALHIQVPI